MLKWVQKGVKRIFKKDKKNRNGNIYGDSICGKDINKILNFYINISNSMNSNAAVLVTPAYV